MLLLEVGLQRHKRFQVHAPVVLTQLREEGDAKQLRVQVPDGVDVGVGWFFKFFFSNVGVNGNWKHCARARTSTGASTGTSASASASASAGTVTGAEASVAGDGVGATGDSAGNLGRDP